MKICRVFQKAVGGRGREVGELWERVRQLCDRCGIVVDRALPIGPNKLDPKKPRMHSTYVS